MILVTFDESESGAEVLLRGDDGPNTPNNGGLTSRAAAAARSAR